MSCTASHRKDKDTKGAGAVPHDKVGKLQCDHHSRSSGDGGGLRSKERQQSLPEPDVSDDSDSYPDDFLYRRERLPSIVVEPTEVSDSESESENSNGDHSEASLDGEQPDDRRPDEGSVARKSSIGLSQSQLSLSRLNPPASLPGHEAAPPCVKS